MNHDELEKKLKELRKKKQEMLHDFTRKAVDAVNQSEQTALTHMSIMDTNDPTHIKGKELKKKKKATDSTVGN